MDKVIRGPKTTFKNETRSLGVFFFETAQTYADKTFQIDADYDLKETYGSAQKRAIRLAIALKNAGVTTDDVIMTCSCNNLDSVIPSLAALYIGAKITSIDPSLTTKECEHLISLVHPKFIFVHEASTEVIQEAVNNIQNSAKFVVIGEHCTYPTMNDFSKPSEGEDCFRPTAVDCKETAVIFFSSGTTGLPKGICCNHFALINNIKSWLSLGNTEADVTFHFTTLYWITAFMILVMIYLKGGCRVLCSKATPEKVLRLIEMYRVTFSFMAPLYTYQLCSVPNASKYDLSSLGGLILGGTPMTHEQLETTRKLFKHSHVQLLYGMTEVSGFLTGNNFDTDGDTYKTKIGSCGKVIPNINFKIVHPETQELLGPYERGELRHIGPYLTNGHYNCASPDILDEEGYFKTGDVAYYDEDGFIFVVGRIKEMFKYQSWHVIPTSIEQVLMEHPDVEDAVVFGVPHEIDGDHPAACIALRFGSGVTEDDIHEFLMDKVNDRHRLRGGIKFVEKILKTNTGKILRWKMREFFLTDK